MADKRKPNPSTNKNISISGDVKDSIVSIGDNNIFQKIVNYIFPSDKETLEQRNRRILLGHVENAWIKGVLDASLHGAALLDLGIKQDLEAVTKYPWAIKKESTDETLPAGLSMLEIFDSIGMGRSLLILGAPGSGKTTMLLELARQLIARAREDVIYPIPMVFNLASWTEKLILADWLAQELNNLYSVPRKSAPDWVKGDKLLLLLDGLDEVRQESRAKCVEAVNAFRKAHGLTSLAVCSRSQDYADLKAKLSFEGAIEVQPLTQEQITEFFNRFGKEMAGIKQVLKKDSALRGMAETPLFLSIMIMAYRDKRDVDIFVSGDEKTQRKHLFNNYVERMFGRPERSNKKTFEQKDILRWLSWLARQLLKQEQLIFLVEHMRQNWLKTKAQQTIHSVIPVMFSLLVGLMVYLGAFHSLQSTGLALILGIAMMVTAFFGISEEPVEITRWSLKATLPNSRKDWMVLIGTPLFLGIAGGFFIDPIAGIIGGGVGFIGGLLGGGFKTSEVKTRTKANQGVDLSIMNAIIFGFISSIMLGLISSDLYWGLSSGLWFALMFGGYAVINHYTLRFLLYLSDNIPFYYVPFLNHCVDLIFLRRVGGGYIFVHRLLMEHFAEMYVETPTSK